jgi:hypothetical protein
MAVLGTGLVVIGGASAATGNNYTGPRDCTVVEAEYGLDFDCSPAAATATQSSTGGVNLYEADGNGGTVTQTNTTGQNIAKCVLTATVTGANTATNQACDFTQSGDGGNSIIANVVANHSFSDVVGFASLTQDANITLTGSQTSTTGSNSVTGPSGAPALLRVAQSLNSNINPNTNTTPPKQTQEHLTLLDVDQVASASGNNLVKFNLETDQDAIASGLSPTQIQDDRQNGAADPNAKAYIYQRTNSGTNNTYGRGLDDKFERSTSLLGSATQRQWHAAGGFDIVADVDSANNPGGGTVDFGTPFASGTDCATVDGFRKIGVIETLNSFGQPTTAGTRVQDDGLPIGIPGLSPQTATVAGCSKLNGPAGTVQAANLSVDGHADGAIVGAIAANLNSGGQTADYVDFNDQTVHVSIGCTRNTPNTCVRTSGGVTGSGTNVSAVEDVPFTGEVATFSNANPSKPVASAEINWGDGSDPSAGTVSQSGGTGNVTGSHTYANPGTYTIDTTLRYADNSVAATMSSTRRSPMCSRVSTSQPAASRSATRRPSAARP